MMKSIKLKVVSPCSESWEEMTPNNKGRFCDACQKNVIDFSEMNNKEIITFFKQNKGKEVCGRLSPFQNNRILFDSIPTKKKFHFPTKVAASVLLAASITGNAAPVANQHYIDPNPIEQLENHTKTKKQKKSDQKFLELSKTIKGKVTDTEGNPIHNARVTFVTMEQRISVYTDKNGNYSLEIPEDLIGNKNVIFVDFDEIKVYIPENFKILSEKKLETLNLEELNEYHKVINPIYETITSIVPLNKVQYNFKAINYGFSFATLGRVSYDEDYKWIYIVNGVEMTQEEYYKANQSGSCSIENTSYLSFEGEAAKIIYGSDDVDEIIFIDSTTDTPM